MRHWIVRLTFSLLVVDAILAVAWCATQHGAFEPYITTIALVATITGLFVDRWLANLERRSELLYVLVHDVYSNQRLFEIGAFQPQPVPNFTHRYPRLLLTGIDAVINSGAFNEEYDAELFIRLYMYRESCLRLKETIDWFEGILSSMGLTPQGADSPRAYRNLQESVPSSPVLTDNRRIAEELMSHLLVKYSRESGLGRGDQLLAMPDHPASPFRRRRHPIRAWANRESTWVLRIGANLWQRYRAWIEREHRHDQ